MLCHPHRAPRLAARAAGRWPDVLDVHLTAPLLTVSVDTVYDLLQRGALPGRKVGPLDIERKDIAKRVVNRYAPIPSP